MGRELNEINASGELTGIQKGGTTEEEKVLTLSEIRNILSDGTIVDFQKGTTDLKPKLMTESEISDFVTALNTGTRWKGLWAQGEVYNRYDMVRDDQWLSCANKQTSDRAAPQPQGDPVLDQSVDPTFVTQQHTGVVWTGHIYTFTTGGWITRIEAKVPTLTGDTNYRFRIIDLTDPDNPIVSVIEEPVLTEGAWTAIFIGNDIVNTGQKIAIIIDALNSGSTSPVVGGWTLGSVDNLITIPTLSQWTASHRDGLLRMDKTDLDSTDRTSELMGMGAGTTVQFAETATPANYNTYYLNSPARDAGTYIEWDMILEDQGGPLVAGVTTTMTAAVPVPQATDFYEEVDYWTTHGKPDFCDVEGYLTLDGVDPGGNEDEAYGIRITFQEALMSPDWDVMADLAGAGGGISSGAAGSTTAPPAEQAAFEDVIYDTATILGVTLSAAEIESVITDPLPLPDETGFLIRDPNNMFLVFWDGTNYYYERLNKAT